MSRFGQAVRDAREAAGLSLADAARRAGIAKSYLSMIENGRLGNPPSPAVVRGIEAALGGPSRGLVELAEWERAPASVREQAQQLRDTAERARSLVRWLGEAASQRREGGRSLDALYRSGALRERIERAVGPLDAGPGSSGSAVLPVPRSVPLINKVAAGYPADFTDLGYPARVADDYAPAPPGLTDADAFAAYVDGDSMLPEYRAGDVVVFSPAADVADGSDCFVRLEESHETTFKRVYFEDGGGRIRLQPLNPRFAPRTLDREAIAGLYRAVWRMSPV